MTNKINEASTPELIKGFMKSEIKKGNRKSKIKGNQGAESKDVLEYLIGLGYSKEDILPLVTKVDSTMKADDLTDEQQKTFVGFQKHVKSGNLTKAQIKLLMRELNR